MGGAIARVGMSEAGDRDQRSCTDRQCQSRSEGVIVMKSMSHDTDLFSDYHFLDPSVLSLVPVYLSTSPYFSGSLSTSLSNVSLLYLSKDQQATERSRGSRPNRKKKGKENRNGGRSIEKNREREVSHTLPYPLQS